MPEQGAAHKRRTGRQARFGSLAGDCQQHNKGAYKWRGSGSTQVTNETCSVGESKCAHPTVEPNSVKLPQQDALLLCTYDCVSPPTQPLRRAARPVVGAGGGAHLRAQNHSARLRAGLTLVGRRLCPVVCGDVGAWPQVLAHRRRGSVAHARQTAPGTVASQRAARAFFCRAARPRLCCAFAKFEGQWHGRLKRSSILWARSLSVALCRSQPALVCLDLY